MSSEHRTVAPRTPDAAGLRLPSMAPLLHFAKRQDIVAWLLAPVT